jgi:hypothetical protein
VSEQALLRIAPPPAHSRLREAEERLATVLAELEALDGELDTLGLELERFAHRYEQALGARDSQVEHVERALRRLRLLQDTVAELTRRLEEPPAEGATQGTRRRQVRAIPHRPPVPPAAELPAGERPEEETPEEVAAAEEAVPERESQAQQLKRLHRRLARLLHPDLAQDEAERVRLGELMARVNAAYEAGDLTGLELFAARLGTGESLDTLTEEERLAHVERRLATLKVAASSLRQQRERLLSTATGRLYEEHVERQAEGRDSLEEARAELEEELEELGEDVRARLVALERAVRGLSTQRSRYMSTLAGSGGKGRKLKAFDPVLESALVRKGVVRLARQRATPAARELARHLEELAVQAPWQVVLTLMAFCAEVAGRPPPGLASAEAWEERYRVLCEWVPLEGAPEWAQALGRLPRHLELGLRVQKEEVRFGVQLRERELVAAVPLALERADVAALGRHVLAVVGPREACRRCGQEGYLLHLLRTRGLDERHGQLCPHCFGVQKSYWLYSLSEGLEALQPHVLRLGMVAEQVVRLAGASIGFQLLPEERAALTAEGLRQRLVELYLAPYGVELAAEHVRLVQGGRELAAEEVVPEGVVVLRLAPEAGTTERELLELLRSRIERRFRPEK